MLNRPHCILFLIMHLLHNLVFIKVFSETVQNIASTKWQCCILMKGALNQGNKFLGYNVLYNLHLNSVLDLNELYLNILSLLCYLVHPANMCCVFFSCIQKNKSKTSVHTYIHTYIHTYMCVCVCVCNLNLQSCYKIPDQVLFLVSVGFSDGRFDFALESVRDVLSFPWRLQISFSKTCREFG